MKCFYSTFLLHSCQVEVIADQGIAKVVKRAAFIRAAIRADFLKRRDYIEDLFA